MKREIRVSRQPLMMGCDAASLRHKLQHADGELRTWWRHFLTLAREDGEWFRAFQPLAFLVTRDAAFRRLAKAAFCRFVEMEPESGLSQEAQFHTHVVAAPLGRWVAFYDWVADADLLSPAEAKAYEAAAIAHAFKFPMQQLHGRSQGFDNQVMSNAFACAAVGHVFGFKRGHNPEAQRLFGLGLSWLRNLLGALPESHYSGEGSTYNEQVAVPVALWSAILYEEVTGERIFDGGLPPNRQGIRGMLELLLKCVGPGGLLPPWDAYGYQHFTTRSMLVYLAKRTGNASALAVIRDTQAWQRLAHPAWECDERVWTLAWWPQELASRAAEYGPWMEPLTAGALQDRRTRTRVFQYWDECGGLPYCGRPEANPNALALEAFGSPLLLDGVGSVDEHLTPLPVDRIVEYAGRPKLERMAKSWGLSGAEGLARVAKHAVGGHLGLSNSLILDGEDWYVPLTNARGQGESCHHAGPLQVVSSESKAYYTDRYDVKSVRRITALCDGRWCVTLDRLEAGKDHRIAWQAFVPKGATATGTRVDAVTPTGVGLVIVPEGEGAPETAEAPAYPTHSPLGSGSTRVRYGGETSGGKYARAFCLVPYPSLEPASGEPCEISAGWDADFGGGKIRKLDLGEAMLKDPGTNREQPRLFRRGFRLTRAAGVWRLRVAAGVQDLKCRVNGKPAASCLEVKGERWNGLTCLAHVFDLTGKVRAGQNVVELEAPFVHGETVSGPVELLKPVGSPSVEFSSPEADSYRVSVGGEQNELLLDNRRGMREFAGGRTDARHAAVTRSAVAVLQATRLERGKALGMSSRAPADVAVLRQSRRDVPTVVLNSLVDNNAVIVNLPEGELRIETAGWLLVSWIAKGRGKVRLQVRPDCARAVMVNGATRGWAAAGQWWEASLGGTARKQKRAEVKDGAAAYAAAFRSGSAAEPALLRALHAGDWETALAAVDALGLAGTQAAGDALLRELAAEFAALPDPPLPYWWQYSKMLHGPGPATPDRQTEVPKGIKRWRLRRALVTALGKLRYREAIPLLIQMAERGGDYFTVSSQIPVALARMEAVEALPVLEQMWDHAEINTQRHARLAVQCLKGEIDPAQFEGLIGPG